MAEQVAVTVQRNFVAGLFRGFLCFCLQVSLNPVAQVMPDQTDIQVIYLDGLDIPGPRA